MQNTRRTFLIYDGHRRWKRMWQFFFTGWGLVMVAALVAGALFTRQLLWTPISAINMKEIAINQFRMTNGSFSGMDKDGNPFDMRAKIARQEYDAPDLIFMDDVSGKITRMTDGKKITDNITAKAGKYDRATRNITLTGDVRVDSSNGDKVRTQELVIKL